MAVFIQVLQRVSIACPLLTAYTVSRDLKTSLTRTRLLLSATDQSPSKVKTCTSKNLGVSLQ